MSNPSAAIGGARFRSPRMANPTLAVAMLCVGSALALAAPTFRTGLYDAMWTDDVMRLVEVRDLLSGQGWFDLVQHRLDPPAGSLMHWSRVIDAPLAALILALRPLAGTQGAELITLVLWPTLLLGGSLLLVAALAGRLSEPLQREPAQLSAIVLATLSVPALVHFRAGAIDHHNLQILLLLAFLLSATAMERSRVQAALAALAATLSLAVGLEMMPAIAAACGVIAGVLVWRGRTVSAPIFVFGAGLAVSSTLLAAALLPPRSLAEPVCDAFGGPFWLLIGGGGVCLMLVAGVDAWRPMLAARLAAAAASGTILLTGFFVLFPGCFASPYAAVDPLVASIWLDHVAETMSFHTMLLLEPQKLPGYYGFPALTLLLAGAAILRAASRLRFPLGLGAVTLAALIAVSVWQLRGAAAANIVAAPIFAIGLAVLWPAPGRQLLVLALVVSPASLTGLGLFARPVIEAMLKPQRMMATEDEASTCRTVSSVAPLAALPPGRVMADIDLGPAILATTGHTVFAAPYHRNNDGNLAMLRVMLAPPGEAEQILRQRRVDYLVSCPSSIEQAQFGQIEAEGLAARLGRGETPDFLQPLPRDPASPIAVWRIRGKGAEG